MTTLDKPRPNARADYVVFRPLSTRFVDNDVYGHVNNAVYFSYIDTAVSGFLLEEGLVTPRESPVIGLAVSSGCDYFESLSFPEPLETGLRVERIGASSVRYGVGVFRRDASEAAAQGFFIHVYVDARSRRPVALPPGLRDGLRRLLRPI